jgi:hypothetical protein
MDPDGCWRYSWGTSDLGVTDAQYFKFTAGSPFDHNIQLSDLESLPSPLPTPKRLLAAFDIVKAQVSPLLLSSVTQKKS